MFNKKKNNNNRPHYKDYQKDPEGFKAYVKDMVEFLRSQGHKDAKAFDLDALLRLMPDDITPETVAETPELAPYISELIQKMGWDVFGDMFTNLGLSREGMEAFLAEDDDVDSLNATGKEIAGLNSGSSSRFGTNKANAIYKQIIDRLGRVIILATSKNDPTILNEPIESLTRVQADTADLAVSDEARNNIQNLLDSTITFQELIDNERTTPEEYNSFLNNMIAHFIADQVNETNETVKGKHDDHDPEQCDLTEFTNDGPLKIVYRRLYSAKDDEVPIPNLHLIVLDTVRGVVHPIAISLHEALSPIAEKTFNSDCRSRDGSNFIANSVISFIRDNEDLVKAMVKPEDTDESEGQAMLRVSCEVVSPTAVMMREVLAETRNSFNVDTQDVFSNLKPEDFFK